MMAVHSVSYFSFQVSVCTGKSSMWIYFNMFLVIWILCYNTSVTGEPQVIGSSQAVLAKVGDDVTLPCHIEPSVDATRVTVEWTRPDLKPEFVYLLQDGHYNTDNQNPLYNQRAFLFTDKLSHGNISLKLFRVTLSDEGAYKCFVPTLDSSWIQLLVGAVSQPVISAIGPKDGGLSLSCDSGCWYPQPEVSWLDSDGNLLINESSVTVGHTQHCYHVQRNVTVRRTGRVTCRVHLPHVNHTVEIHNVIPIAETRNVIPIAELVIPESSAVSPGAIAAIVFTVIVILVAALLGYLYGKKKGPTGDLADLAFDGLTSIETDEEKGDLAGLAFDGLTSIETDEEKARFVVDSRQWLKANVSKVMAVVGSLGSKVDPELRTELETIPSSIGKMILLYYAVLDKGETDTRAAFYDALKKHDPNSLKIMVKHDSDFSKVKMKSSIRSSTLEDHHPARMQHSSLKSTLSESETTRSNRGAELMDIPEYPHRGRSNTGGNMEDRYRQRGQDGSERREGPVERELLTTDGEDKMDPNTERNPLLTETEDHLEPDTEIDQHNQTC